MPVPVTIATFNIRNGHAPDGWNHWLLRRRITAAWTAGLDADVVGLQEVYGFQLRRISRAMPEWAPAGRGRNRDGGGEQVPVLVRRPFTIREVGHRWFSETPEVAGSLLGDAKLPRLATTVTIDHPDLAEPFRVVNLHIDHRSEANRRRSLEQLVRDTDDTLPTVVMGDFNADPARSKIFGPLLDAGFRDVPTDGGTFHAWGRKDDKSPRIDLIYVRDGGSSTWTTQRAEVVRAAKGRRPSDHWPVRALLSLTPDR